MNPKQIDLVQESFALVLPIADEAAAIFYERLFLLDPALRPLFRGDIAEQGKKLMSMLALAINGLKNPEKIIPALQHLGRRHVGYGIQPAHYDTVGEALLWTLAQGLGEAFTVEVEAAWTAVYTLVATVMQEAAAESVLMPA
ncbi:MAG TPA: globin family protein [Chloroflexota bacterium]|nr:globin family protein [Chloroflexota bacterium]HUM72464.1 globin family protein [Chloroflexota bacterium]